MRSPNQAGPLLAGLFALPVCPSDLLGRRHDQSYKFSESPTLSLFEIRMIGQLEIPHDLLTWRFGHEITLGHRTAVAEWLARQGNYPMDVTDATKKACLTDPDDRFAELLAPFVGVMSAMDVRTFLREFPAAGNKDDDGLILEIFMRMRFPREGEPL